MNIKKIASFAIGPIGSAVLGFVTLPLITWLYSPEDVGRMSMLNIAISFCVLLFSLGLDQSYVREYHESPEKGVLLKSAIAPGFFLLLLTCIAFLFQPSRLSLLLFDEDSSVFSVLTMLILIFTFISRFLSLILRMKEKGMAYSLSLLIPKLVIIIVIINYYFFVKKHDFLQLIIANMIGFGFVFLILALNTKDDWLTALRSSFSIKKIKTMLSFGYPLILGGLAFWGVTAADRMFLRAMSNFEQLAIFSVAVSFASAATIIQSVFSTIWAPIVYKVLNTGDGALELVNKASRYMLVAVVCIFCVCGLLSWIVDFFLPTNYGDVKFILVACLGYPLLYTLSETTVIGISISKKTSYSMLASLLAFVVNLVGNFLLVPTFGAAGAAVSTCVTFWFFFILRTEFSIITWKVIPRFEMYFFTFLCIFGASCSALLGESIKNEIFIYWLVLFIFVILRNYRELKFFLAKRIR
ncbi:MAG: lipopolysaccharide biosynthesis protein [Serratia sp. (in: enterobacteria)]|uniref:lipopolysaccharide biosynthesis protein n=1 Tax=Serratia sp. (in: enterobacteria) TaxID=616 RepID=UPI003F40E11E